MKDIVIKDNGHRICAGVAKINDKDVYYTNNYQLLAAAYNEMFDTHYSFLDIILNYIENNDIAKIKEIQNACSKRCDYFDSLIPPVVDDPSLKWDGFTVIKTETN